MIALTVEVGQFVEMQSGQGQFAVLVDFRPGENKGLILQHPLYNQLGKVPERFKYFRVTDENLPRGDRDKKVNYEDPFSHDELGEAFQGRWLAESAPVRVREEDSGLWVIVQETHQHAIGPTLNELGSSLYRIGWIGVGTAVAVVIVLWGLVVRWLGGASRRRAALADPTANTKKADTMATIVK
jgi:hypothetical protein